MACFSVHTQHTLFAAYNIFSGANNIIVTQFITTTIIITIIFCVHHNDEGGAVYGGRAERTMTGQHVFSLRANTSSPYTRIIIIICYRVCRENTKLFNFTQQIDTCRVQNILLSTIWPWHIYVLRVIFCWLLILVLHSRYCETSNYNIFTIYVRWMDEIKINCIKISLAHNIIYHCEPT